MERPKTDAGQGFEEDSCERNPVQEQGCLVNPSAAINSTQNMIASNEGTQRSLQIFVNCLRLALEVPNHQDKKVGNSDDDHIEISTVTLIQSIRLVQLCHHIDQDGDFASVHFAQLLHGAMRSLNYLEQRRRRVWNNPWPSMR